MDKDPFENPLRKKEFQQHYFLRKDTLSIQKLCMQNFVNIWKINNLTALMKLSFELIHRYTGDTHPLDFLAVPWSVSSNTTLIIMEERGHLSVQEQSLEQHWGCLIPIPYCCLQHKPGSTCYHRSTSQCASAIVCQPTLSPGNKCLRC